MLNIVITGASSGIGKAFKEYYEKRGDKVINISREQDADYPCNIVDREAMEKVFADIATKIDKIDILINCAGFGVSGAVETVPLETVKSIYDVNIIGNVNVIQLGLPLMREKSKIVNISSVAAFFPTPFRGYYGSSKAAVSMLTDSLRMELSRTGIQVTAICPSEIRTNFSKNRVKSTETNERYGNAIARSTEIIEARDHKRMPLEKAAKIMLKWINKKRLKPEYIMSFKFKLLYRVIRLAPKGLYLKICSRCFNKTK